MPELTFATLLTPAGIVIAGGLVRQLVEVVKTAFPAIDARLSGAAQAFIASTGLYIATALALLPLTPDQGLQIFASWLAVAAVAIGVNSAVSHVTGGGD